MAYSTLLDYATNTPSGDQWDMMLRKTFLITVLALALPLGAVADARPRERDQDAAYEARQQGRIMSLRTIESRIVPRMGGADYLGPELDAGSGRYRLKFMREGRVIWVDVDARTGQLLGRSGN